MTARQSMAAKMIDALRRNLIHRGTPTIPAGGDLLWHWFMDMSRTRSYNAAGPNPITYEEIRSYRDLMLIPLEPWHVQVIRAMDDAYIEAAYARRAMAPEGVKILPKRIDEVMTGGMFDAMFGGDNGQ